MTGRTREMKAKSIQVSLYIVTCRCVKEEGLQEWFCGRTENNIMAEEGVNLKLKPVVCG
jgi:hypothetical protein